MLAWHHGLAFGARDRCVVFGRRCGKAKQECFWIWARQFGGKTAVKTPVSGLRRRVFAI